MSDSPLTDSTSPPPIPTDSPSSEPVPAPAVSSVVAEGGGAGGGGSTAETVAFLKKKRLRHRGGRGRNKKFSGDENGGDAEGEDDAEGADEDTGTAVDATTGESKGEPSSADIPGATPPGAEGVVTQPPRREPRRDPREPRPGDRGPRQETRPPRPERQEPRAHQGPRSERSERPERFERPERIDRTPLDTRELSEKAWQLFFGELREEGLALIDETDAEKLSNRCFKLAEIFMRQRQRRINQFASTGTTLHEERRSSGPPEPRMPPPPRPKPEIPIEQRLPDDPAKLSKEETEALIEEAQEVAEKKAEMEVTEVPGDTGSDETGSQPAADSSAAVAAGDEPSERPLSSESPSS